MLRHKFAMESSCVRFDIARHAWQLCLLLGMFMSNVVLAETLRQWQMVELEFLSEKSHTTPNEVELTATFSGPDGQNIVVPGFWDGGKIWKIRFTPNLAGQWMYATKASDLEDTGLQSRVGAFLVHPAVEDNALYAHGGFLYVSENKRYLTYSDGAPFFWLGDTWWFCPSRFCPLSESAETTYGSMFKKLVDTRKKQGYTVIQMAFADIRYSLPALYHPKKWDHRYLKFWKEFDDHVKYANDAGLVLAIALGFQNSLRKDKLENLKHVWRYMIARYGAYPVTWLVAAEYNLDNDEDSVKKIIELGAYIKKIDPYKRALSLHPWVYNLEKRQAWQEGWYDYIMLQGGHGDIPPVKVYLDAYNRVEKKPILESECSYEGIGSIKADRVRLVAYRAIQSGSFGYTYGSHGLWYPSQSEQDTKTQEWGKTLPWWAALKRHGGVQMKHLRTIYESVRWWHLHPASNAVLTIPALPEEKRILASREGDQTFVIYFPMGVEPVIRATLLNGDSNGIYTGTWFNPRTGKARHISGEIRMAGEGYTLPARPNNNDWLLVLRKM